MHQYIFVLVYCMSAKIFTTHPFNSITMFRLTYHSSSGQSEPNRLKSSNRHCFAFRQYPFKCKFPLRYFRQTNDWFWYKKNLSQCIYAIVLGSRSFQLSCDMVVSCGSFQFELHPITPQPRTLKSLWTTPYTLLLIS